MKKTRIYGAVIGALGLALVVLVGYSVTQRHERNLYKLMLSNAYDRAFREAAGHAANVDSLLGKLDVLELPAQAAPLYAEIWKQSDAAHSRLSSLPYAMNVVVEAQKYLTQVSDLSYALLLKTLDGERLNEEDRQNLAQVRRLAPAFSDGLTSIINQAAVTGGMNWDMLAGEGEADASGVAPEALTGSLHMVTQPLHEAPMLIYDGPFSDHIQNLAPRLTAGLPMLTRSEGREIVLNLLAAEDIASVEWIGETAAETGAAVPVLSYAARRAGDTEPSLYIDVTKHGGVPLWMLRAPDENPDGARITLQAAAACADVFLRQAGFADMQYSYYEYAEASVVINYAPAADGVLLYPDLVKVKVSMADGSIEGLEALGYVMMHGPREIAVPRLTPAEAMSCVSPKLSILGTQLALIPLGSYREVLCYEFRTARDGAEYLVYINADSGKMEKLFELVINDYGALVQ